MKYIAILLALCVSACTTGAVVKVNNYARDGLITKGSNDQEQLTRATSTDSVKSISAGYGYTCAVISNGHIKCWGQNNLGALGNGDSSHHSSAAPALVKGIDSAIDVSAGHAHTCAVLLNGAVKCWGLNNWGQLGNGNTKSSDVPVSVKEISNAKAVAVGTFHTCALLTDGLVKCWGATNVRGRINGNKHYSSIPQTVKLPKNASSITDSPNHACALLSDGTIYCWGNNAGGQLGNGTNIDSIEPVKVKGIENAISITAGKNITCALLSDSSVKCWGLLSGAAKIDRNSNNNSKAHVPNVIEGLDHIVDVSSGTGGGSCAVNERGYVACWGLLNGLLFSGTPRVYKSIRDAIQVSVGGLQNCALLKNGHVQCWGFNGSGQMGIGTTSITSSPGYVIELDN